VYEAVNSYVTYLGIASAWVGNTTRYVVQSCLCILCRFNYQWQWQHKIFPCVDTL